MKTVKIELIDRVGYDKDNFKPRKAHANDACYDIFAADDVLLAPHQTSLVKAGFRIELPAGWECEIRGRSGNTLKKGFCVLLGTVDSGYTGEVGVIVHHLGDKKNVEIRRGDKIAQMAIRPCPEVVLEYGEIEKNTERGDNGFGSSGD